MILSDYLSRHRQKDLDPSELIPISFCCLKTYRSIIDDRIGEEIFCIKTRASAKASGETVGEVHGADNVVLLHCGCLSLNPFIEFRIRNNLSSSRCAIHPSKYKYKSQV